MSNGRQAHHSLIIIKCYLNLIMIYLSFIYCSALVVPLDSSNLFHFHFLSVICLSVLPKVCITMIMKILDNTFIHSKYLISFDFRKSLKQIYLYIKYMHILIV